MRFLWVISLVIGFTFLNSYEVISQSSQVQWEEDFELALAKAKQQNKLLFVECYLTTCPVCNSLEPLFKNKEVSDVYNSSFVNFKLDGAKRELVKPLIDRQIYVPNFPLFLFFNGDGELVHQSGVNVSVASLVDVAITAQDPNKRTDSYKRRYQAGERNPDFLSSYAYQARVSNDTALTIELGEQLFEAFPKEDLNKEISWLLTKKCIVDVNNGFAQYWFQNYETARAIEQKNGHPGGENNVFGGILQHSISGQRAKSYTTRELANIRNYMGLINVSQYADSYLWELETKANLREGNTAIALAIGNKMVQKFAANGSAAVYIAKVFIDNSENKSFIPDARKWLTEALPNIQQDNQKAEYHYESARLYQLAGDLEEAKKEAKIALDLANKAAILKVKFSDLISTLD